MINNFELLKTHLYKLIKEELEGGEEEKQAGLEKAMYDLVLEPADLQAALAALSDVKNYGIYANNLRDPKIITKIFGPSVPATKGRVAKETWDQSNENEKLSKIIDIKSRAPQEWAKVEQQLQSKFDEWSVENDNDSFNEFIITLDAKDLPMDFFGKYASTFYPMKTPDNLKKYSGVMAKDKDFVVDGDKIVFPQKKNPFETKDYLTKVLKTIMGNAKLQYSISQKESDDQPATTSNTQGAVEKINFVKTFDTPELAAKFKKLIPKDFAEKTVIDGGKITVSDITDSQKKNLIASALQFIASQPKKPMKESIKDQIKKAVMEVLQEKKLTKAEKNKKEDIVKAMAKQGAPKDTKTYAIATAKAKKLAEAEEGMSNEELMKALDEIPAKELLKGLGQDAINVLKQAYQKARTGLAKQYDVDLNEAEEETDTVDTITMDVPLFIRMLEYAREDASADVDLHDVAENAVSLNKQQDILSMDDYDALLPSDAEPMDEARFEKGEDIGKKGKGFAKIVKSAAKEYGSEEAGKRVAGAILKKVMKK